MERLRSQLDSQSLLTPEVEAQLHRVIAVPGDLTRPALSLEHAQFRTLAGEVDAIIHSGAEVNLVKPYSSLRLANVLGTQEVLRLAATRGVFGPRLQPVYFISSNAVFPQNMCVTC